MEGAVDEYSAMSIMECAAHFFHNNDHTQDDDSKGSKDRCIGICHDQLKEIGERFGHKVTERVIEELGDKVGKHIADGVADGVRQIVSDIVSGNSVEVEPDDEDDAFASTTTTTESTFFADQREDVDPEFWESAAAPHRRLFEYPVMSKAAELVAYPAVVYGIPPPVDEGGPWLYGQAARESCEQELVAEVQKAVPRLGLDTRRERELSALLRRLLVLKEPENSVEAQLFVSLDARLAEACHAATSLPPAATL
eukprot:Protomagalhaensia_wolfi_Nauph_80__1980@NODE_2251_length_1151_cov_4_482014_g1756_i0_p1_GENE_NODE_2251_length_1151_cov_4_482014_g1756_i0NODE_2251_length_1151_cov_4_482014_g1756_i0_p1_ORF_typecomplete_len253_score55_49Lig_chanGlu_bd/PF10613_9/0_044_NODE_2251_length_1151_cov_4_482014_g1756_i0159917